jgi:PHD/YefM family antitoxin component YafN of YafNO toxin-antitoxin module
VEQLKMMAVSKARANLFDLAEDPQPTLLLRHSSPRAVLVPYGTWVEIQREIEDLKGTLAAYRSLTNSSPDLRLSTEKVLAELGFSDDE